MLAFQQLFYLLIGLGALLGLPAFWFFAKGMWPRCVEHAREVASRSLFANFICGLPVVGLIIFLLTQAGKIRAAGGSIAGGLAVLAFFWGLVGVAGLASHIGARIWPVGNGSEEWRSFLRGSIVVAGSLAIPFIGWFLLPLVLITIGVGIRVRMWFVRGVALAPQPQAAPLPVAAANTAPAIPQQATA
jgi:hypothetical protein